MAGRRRTPSIPRVMHILSSQTRTSTRRIRGLRFIDQILFKVLRWDENDVWPEEYVKNVGYLDYEFGRPQCSLVSGGEA